MQMNLTAKKNGLPSCILFLLLTALLGKNIYAVGQSAVITLTFPTGGRPTALGEAFTALADDANATFYNPAGLGQSPLASSWKTFLPDSSFTAIASMRRGEFGYRDRVWAGSGSQLFRFNGRVWVGYETHLLEREDDLQSIVNNFITNNDQTVRRKALWEIQSYNNIGMNRYKTILPLIRENATISQLSEQAKSVEDITQQMVLLPKEDRSYSGVHALIHPFIDSSKVRQLTDSIVTLLNSDDIELNTLTELKIPFSIAVTDSVTSMIMDRSERLWVGTHSGLWRRDNQKWTLFTLEDGLPSNNITTITAGPNGQIAVGTDKGLALLEAGEWQVMDTRHGLPNSLVTSIAFDFSNTIFVGTPEGLFSKTGQDSTMLFDTSTGLLSNSVYALMFDSQERLWIGGDQGVTLRQRNRWRRFRFPESKVHCFAEHDNDIIWIGTDNGAITYKEGRVRGEAQPVPEWNSFHSRNALRGDDVRSITIHGNDVWLATDKAIHQYDYSQKQFLFFYEQLLPAFRISDLWHIYSAFVLPTEEWGTFGLSINYIMMGTNEYTDEMGRALGQKRSWEGIFSLSYGFAIKEDLSLGLNIKYVHSALAPGIGESGEGTGRTFAIDAGVLKRDFLVEKLDLGFMLQNMGPKIFYVSEDQADPIPFTLRLGTAYRAVQTPVHDLTILLDAYREVVKNNPDGDPDPFWKALWTDLLADQDDTWIEEIQAVIIGLGLEYWYSDFIALRSGFLGDYMGERFELTLGLGIRYGNLNFDWSYIHSPEGFMGGFLERVSSGQKKGAHGARHGQWRASFLFGF